MLTLFYNKYKHFYLLKKVKISVVLTGSMCPCSYICSFTSSYLELMCSYCLIVVMSYSDVTVNIFWPKSLQRYCGAQVSNMLHIKI